MPRRTALLALLTLALAPAARAADDWKAGVATVQVTPAANMWMAGYAARTKPSEGKAQDLFAKALALEDANGTRLVVLTMDLISVPRRLRDSLEKACGEQFKLPAAGLLINCSHTHCGPELRFTPPAAGGAEDDRNKQSREYATKLEADLLAVIGKALGSMTPAKLNYCHARCGFAMNRRLPTDKGFANSPYSDGPVDHDVPVLRVESDGKLKAVVFGYACHNTTLGFYQFCGDYAGYAQEFLERTNPGATAMFILGCGGDQNPYPRGTLDLAQQHGMALANAVGAAFQAKPKPVRGPLRTAYGVATVDYAKPFPTKDELAKTQAETKDQYEKARAGRLLKHLETAAFPDSYPAPVQVVRFGDDILLAGMPGETVVDYSLRLKKELGGKGPAVWVAGYCNDVFTYVPSKRVLEEGGYEGGGAMRYSSFPHPNVFAPTVEERLIGKVHELVKATSGPGR